jgi:hypothetical protein
LIAAWEAEGNVIPPYVAPPPSLQMDISDRQFFQQLAISGLITEEGLHVYADWPVTGSVHRIDNSYTEAFAAMKGISSEQVDDLWRKAAALV